MDYYDSVIDEAPHLYKIVALTPFRHTPGVSFDLVPRGLLGRINAIDRVMHLHNAVSPGPIGDVERPWYMHPNQDDNLIVMHGIRHIELYSVKHGAVERFDVTADSIIHKHGSLVHQGAAMLVWPRGVFHRIESGPDGSASLNFAVHYTGIDMRTNFNIYDLDPKAGTFSVLREGHLDQTGYTEVRPVGE